MDDTWPIIGKSNDHSTSTIMEKDELSEDNLYSIRDDPGLIECFATLVDHDINFVDFIKEHTCYLNLPEIKLDENP